VWWPDLRLPSLGGGALLLAPGTSYSNASSRCRRAFTGAGSDRGERGSLNPLLSIEGLAAHRLMAATLSYCTGWSHARNWARICARRAHSAAWRPGLGAVEPVTTASEHGAAWARRMTAALVRAGRCRSERQAKRAPLVAQMLPAGPLCSGGPTGRTRFDCLFAAGRLRPLDSVAEVCMVWWNTAV